MSKGHIHRAGPARRDFLRLGAGSLGLSLIGTGGRAATLTPPDEAATPKTSDRILVVVELSGANDGLNTVVPYANDIYHRARPTLGIRAERVLRLDDQFGLHPSMTGMAKMFKDGHLAIVQNVGYEQPSFSHFTSMAYWHTAAPNSGEAYGWLGRLADCLDRPARPDFLVDVQDGQSLAVRAREHVALVFNDPAKFNRAGFYDEREALRQLIGGAAANPAKQFLDDVARSAQSAEKRVSEACSGYKTPVEYGLIRFGLERVAALIAAGFESRIYYVTYPHNAFDTHVFQADTHARLLNYVSDHVSGFLADMRRIGREKDVAVMMFSEFGRRVGENANRGTDHGTAGPVFVAGAGVTGGIYGPPPDLGDLEDGNLRYKVDFRRVYATMVREWMKMEDVSPVLTGDFPSLDIFRAA